VPALIFDCDGVLADTERFGHLPAFNQTFAEFGLPVQWSEDDYAQKVLVGGGKERIRTLLTPEFVAAAGLPTDPAGQDAAVARWHARKTEIYTSIIAAGSIPGRPGIARIAAEAVEGDWRLAVASTSAEPSVRSVLVHAVGPELAERFAVFAGDVVAHKKPAPDIYLLAVESLGVPTEDVVVIEDSRNGLLAALAAGLTCVVTVSSYTREEDFTGAALVVDSLGDPPPAGPDGQGVETDVLADEAGVTAGTFIRLSELTALRPAAARTRQGS
jgi:beta-phosphoglucomutase-like phosphatase (HAD superfamily)